MPNNSELASQFAARQADAIKDLARLPISGARQIPIIWGLTADCTTAADLESLLVQATDVLVASQRVFVFGNSLVLASDDGQCQSLFTLSTGQGIEKGAVAKLANVFLCGYETAKGDRMQRVPTEQVVGTLLAREPTRKALPRIELYANRPVFAPDFSFCGPGWHERPGILVHGPAVAPVMRETIPGPDCPALERLPPHLRTLLSGFCFASDADLANAVGMMLTGLLMSHHTETLHPLGLLDANQPGAGKTMLARTIGMVLDGRDPRLISYTPNDEELNKRTLATIRDNNQSVLTIDNAKTRAGNVVSSPFLEANAVAAEIALRILGQSQNYVRPNDLLWFLTMNDTKVSPDLVSRCVPIRFHCEGDPAQRQFDIDPVAYARQNRTQILGELAAMVMHWNQQGRKPANRAHRLRQWAEQIGGILEANGLPEFLTNLQAAANDFNSELDELAALAEECLKANRYWYQADENGQSNAQIVSKGAIPSKWSDLLNKAQLLQDKLQSTKGTKGHGQVIGNFLSKFVNREVPVRFKDQDVTATLRVASGNRSRERLYCFEISGELVEAPTTPSNKPQSRCATAKESVAMASVAKALVPFASGKQPAPISTSARKERHAHTPVSASGTMSMATTPGNGETWA